MIDRKSRSQSDSKLVKKRLASQDTVLLRIEELLRFNLKDLKRNIAHSKQRNWCDHENSSLSSFCSTNSIILYILPQLFHTLVLCSTHSLFSTWYHLQLLTQRSNHFLKVIHVGHSFAFQPQFM